MPLLSHIKLLQHVCVSVYHSVCQYWKYMGGIAHMCMLIACVCHHMKDKCSLYSSHSKICFMYLCEQLYFILYI